MHYRCPIRFEEGKLPLGIKPEDIEELKKNIGIIRKFSDSLIGLGCKGIEVESYDMSVDESGPEREQYGIVCKTYDGGEGCKTCILKYLDHKSKKLSDFYISIMMQSDVFSALDEWAQSPSD